MTRRSSSRCAHGPARAGGAGYAGRRRLGLAPAVRGARDHRRHGARRGAVRGRRRARRRRPGGRARVLRRVGDRQGRSRARRRSGRRSSRATRSRVRTSCARPPRPARCCGWRTGRRRSSCAPASRSSCRRGARWTQPLPPERAAPGQAGQASRGRRARASTSGAARCSRASAPPARWPSTRKQTRTTTAGPARFVVLADEKGRVSVAAIEGNGALRARPEVRRAARRGPRRRARPGRRPEIPSTSPKTCS